MGLFSSIGNAIGAIKQGAKELVSGGISQIPKNVVKRVEEKIAPIVGARHFTPEEKTIIVGTAAAAGALAAAPIIVAAAPAIVPTATKLLTTSASSVGKTIASNPVKTALIAPVAVSAIISNPIGATKSAGKIIDAQVDLGKAISNPSLASAKEFISDHPIATAATAVAAGLVVTKAVAPLVSAAITRDAIDDQTKALLKETEKLTESIPSVNPLVLPAAGVSNSSPAAVEPVLPKTELIATTSTTSGKSRKRKAAKPAIQNINQKVNVIMQNKSSVPVKLDYRISVPKRYLNRRILAT